MMVVAIHTILSLIVIGAGAIFMISCGAQYEEGKNESATVAFTIGLILLLVGSCLSFLAGAA